MNSSIEGITAKYPFILIDNKKAHGSMIRAGIAQTVFFFTMIIAIIIQISKIAIIVL